MFQKFSGNFLLIFALICVVQASFKPIAEKLEMIEKSKYTEVKPCDHFFGHACWKWKDNYGTENYSSMKKMVAYNFNIQLKELLDKELKKEESAESAFVKMKAYYKSCAVKNSKLEYAKYIKLKAGLEWPFMQEITNGRGKVKWSHPDFDLFELLGELHLYGFNDVLTNIVATRLANETLQIHFNLPNAENCCNDGDLFYTLREFRENYEVYSTQFLETGRFWRRAYENCSLREYHKNQEFLTFAQLKHAYPNLWRLLESMLGTGITHNDEIYINNVCYYRFLNAYKVPESDSQHLANYLLFHFLDYASKEPQTDCIEELKNKMPLALNFFYIQETMTMAQKEELQFYLNDMSEKLKKYFLITLEENFMRLQPSQIAKLKEKLSLVTINVGKLPKNVQNMEEINDLFELVDDLDENDFPKNHLKLLRHRLYYTLMYSEYQNMDFVESMSYDMANNVIYIPFSHLQAPFYDPNYDDIFTYSSLLYLMSVELANSITGPGLQGNVAGSRQFEDILNHLRYKNFQECLQSQNGADNENLTKDSIAETIGLRVAFRAYLEEYEKFLQPYSTSIPWNQLFFLNVAQIYCGDGGVDFKNIHQALINSEDFAKAFDCPPESRMNPGRKCRLY
uniref:Peptidase M13 C-terminal domain-containing protein n=1 Tax=Stomoxys calcitrans TaxID=35570 RepID=A0A1I8PSA6_STOCA